MLKQRLSFDEVCMIEFNREKINTYVYTPKVILILLPPANRKCKEKDWKVNIFFILGGIEKRHIYTEH